VGNENSKLINWLILRKYNVGKLGLTMRLIRYGHLTLTVPDVIRAHPKNERPK